MMIKKISRSVFVMMALLMVSCGTKKTVTDNSKIRTQSSSSKAQDGIDAGLAFVQQVSDARLYQKNIVGEMTFTIKAGGVDQSLPGALRMRKDEVIRIQVMAPVIQVEIGRIEFTPEYVMVIDRWHKEYIKTDYNQLGFLKDNGLDFYSLQSLFWNELLLPGSQKVKEGDLGKFSADLSGQGSEVPVTFNSGKLSFKWNASRNDYKLLSAIVSYEGSSLGTSQLVWNYSDFKSVGVKSFPAMQTFTFSTKAAGKAHQATISMRMGSIRTDANWEAHTVPSDKYKKMNAGDILDKILKMR